MDHFEKLFKLFEKILHLLEKLLKKINEEGKQEEEEVILGRFDDVLFELGELEDEMHGGMPDLHIDAFIEYEDT